MGGHEEVSRSAPLVGRRCIQVEIYVVALGAGLRHHGVSPVQLGSVAGCGVASMEVGSRGARVQVYRNLARLVEVHGRSRVVEETVLPAWQRRCQVRLVVLVEGRQGVMLRVLLLLLLLMRLLL